MSTTRSWWYQQALARPWFIYVVCGVVALLVVPYWLALASQGPPDGVDTVRAPVVAVANPGDRTKDVDVRVGSRPQRVSYTGDVAVGDRITVWRQDGAWHTGHERSWTTGLMLTVLVWGFAGFAAWGVYRRAPRSGDRVREGLA